jgi:acyl dehydratase
MSVSSRHILEQGRVLAALGRTALSALGQRVGGAHPRGAPVVPGPEIRASVPSPSPELVAAYVRELGGDPKSWRGEVPPHLFPQWSFPLATRTLEGLPYPLLRVVNGGCRMEARAPIVAGETLDVRAHLASIDDDGKRAVLQQHVVTGTKSAPDALVADFYAIVPLASSGAGAPREKKPRPTVPADAREIARYRLKRDAGLSFAKLTGDFNPIHWLAPYARASGFRDVILHGFGTFARAAEGLARGLLGGDVRALAVLDAKFTRPLVLPADVGLYVRGGEVFVGDVAGGPAYMTGRFETKIGR